MKGDSPGLLGDKEIANLEAAAEGLRKVRADADEALMAVETLLSLAKRRRPPAPVIPLRPARSG
jgi:hypothetical protein